MLLAIDLGNTQTHLGLFRDEELVEHWRLATVRETTADELATLLVDLLTPPRSPPAGRCSTWRCWPAG